VGKVVDFWPFMVYNAKYLPTKGTKMSQFEPWPFDDDVPKELRKFFVVNLIFGSITFELGNISDMGFLVHQDILNQSNLYDCHMQADRCVSVRKQPK